MTTLKDMLRDFQYESIRAKETKFDIRADEEELARKEMLQELLDDLVETIKERWVG